MMSSIVGSQHLLTRADGAAGMEHLMDWENVLFGWAFQAHACQEHPDSLDIDPALLARAYQHCAQLTGFHSRTFYLASGLLPPEKRQAVRALYAFCRVSDDLVDCGGDRFRTNLAQWRERALAPRPPDDDPVALAWGATRSMYRIPRGLIEQFFDGVELDLARNRYETFEQLAQYAYGVASTVGLMVMHIVGYAGPQAIPYAVKLGVALQVTNILRDVGEDWRAGRLYLPLQELAAFGLAESDVAACRTDERWAAFMRFQIARNRRLYAAAAPGIHLLHPAGRFAIGAASGLYEAILGDIERHGADVFSRRAHIGALGKLRRLPHIWWRSRGPGNG